MEYLLKINREFQDRVVRVRMFPLENTFRRFQRMVRDLAFQQDKLIRVSIRGLDTELDKEVIEHITDPLKHLVRNCVDHGIEPSEERMARGKPVEGKVEFRAYQREGKIYIEIRDDGRGIDVDAIRQRALSEGWMSSNQELSREALLNLIFKPGFSLSSSVTEFSGRGVGMDVVKTRIEQLGGTIEVFTERDKGTRFVLCLPLKFSLMDGLHVRVRDMTCLIPLQAVAGTQRLEKPLLKSMGAEGKMYLFRGDYVPLIDLPKLFDLKALSDPHGAGILVFLDTGRRTFGIPVDEILEPQQIIIKSLEANFRSIKGVAGAAIMGDGSVSLVLDLLGVEEMFFAQAM
jgi:two-component system chemotaxis sensor kinase CheA